MKTAKFATSVITSLFIFASQFQSYIAPSCDIVRCRSHGQKYRTCDVDARLGKKVNLKYEDRVSKESCREDRSYGLSRGRIWVDRSCKAYFRVCGKKFRRRSNDCQLLKCESKNKRLRRCYVDRDLGPKLTMTRRDRLSSRSCRRGKSYGLRGRHVWVDKGCRAYFRVCGKKPSEVASKIPSDDAIIQPTQSIDKQSTPSMLPPAYNQIQAISTTIRPPKLVPHYDSDVADTKVDVMKYSEDDSQRDHLGDWLPLHPVVEHDEEHPFASFLPLPSDLSKRYELFLPLPFNISKPQVIPNHSSFPNDPVAQLPVRKVVTSLPANQKAESKYVTPPGFGSNQDMLITQMVNLLTEKRNNQTASSGDASNLGRSVPIPTNMTMLQQMMRDAFKRKRFDERFENSAHDLANRVEGKQLVQTRSGSKKLDPIQFPSNDLPPSFYKQYNSRNSSGTNEISNSISNIPVVINEANFRNLNTSRLFTRPLDLESIANASVAGMSGTGTGELFNNGATLSAGQRSTNYDIDALPKDILPDPPQFDSLDPLERVFDAPMLSFDPNQPVQVPLPGVYPTTEPSQLNTDNLAPGELLPSVPEGVLPPSNDLPPSFYKQYNSRNNSGTNEISNIPVRMNDANFRNLNTSRLFTMPLDLEAIANASADGLSGTGTGDLVNSGASPLAGQRSTNYQIDALPKDILPDPSQFDSLDPLERVFDAPILSFDPNLPVQVPLPEVYSSTDPSQLNTENLAPGELLPSVPEGVLPPNANSEFIRAGFLASPAQARMFPISDQSLSTLYLGTDLASLPSSDSGEQNSSNKNFDPLIDFLEPAPTNFIPNTPRLSDARVHQSQITTPASLSIPRGMPPRENAGTPTNIPELIMPLDDLMATLYNQGSHFNFESTGQTVVSGLSITDHNSDIQDSFRAVGVNLNVYIASPPLTESISQPFESETAPGNPRLIPPIVSPSDPVYSITDTGLSPPDSGFRLPDTGFSETEPRLNPSDPGFSASDPGSSLSEPGIGLPDPGFSLPQGINSENGARVDRLKPRRPYNAPRTTNSRRRVSAAARAYIRQLIAARERAADQQRSSIMEQDSLVQLFQCIGTNACGGRFRVRF